MKMPYETQGEREGRGYGVEKGEHTENNNKRGRRGGGGTTSPFVGSINILPFVVRNLAYNTSF